MSKEQKSKFSQAEVRAKLKLKLLRESQRISMVQMAKNCNYSVKQIEDIESARNYGRHLSFDVIVALADGFNISPSALMRLITS